MAAKKSASQAAVEQTAEAAGSTFDAFTPDYAGFADAARGQYETALKTFNDNAEMMRAHAEESFAAARVGFETAGEKLRAVSADAMTQAREEMTGAVEFANELSRAKTLGDALEIQRNYWTKLFETRVERARAMTEASVEASRSAFEPLNKSFGSALSFTPSFDKFFPFASK